MNSDLDSEYQIFLGNFLTLCKNPQNNEAYEATFQKAKSPNPSDFKLFIQYNLSIIHNSQLNVIAPKYAVILIMNSFKYGSFNEIRNKWFHQDVLEIHQELKSTISSGLGNNDLQIRNVCSAIISIIALLEENSWMSICEILIKNIKEKEQNIILASGSIHCLTEIFSFPFIANFPPNKLPNYMGDLVMCLAFSICDQNLILPSRIDACTALMEITNQLPFSYDFMTVSTIIQIIIRSLDMSDLYINLYKLLLSILKKNTKIIEDNLQLLKSINDLIHNEIETKRGNYKIVNICFWDQFAKYERKKSNDHSLTMLVVPEFVDQLLKCLIDIEDPENQEPEDPSAGATTHLAALTTLQSFFLLNSQVIFESISNFFNKLIRSPNWIEVLAAIYSISALCDDEPRSPDETYYDTVKNYLESILPLLITHAGECAMCPRIKETSMWVISQVIFTYQPILENDEIVNSLLELFEETMSTNYPPIIITRSCRIFCNVANFSKKEFFDTDFCKFSDIIMNIIQNYQLSNNPTVVYKPFNALNALIKNCSDTCEELITKLMYDFLNKISDEENPLPISLVTPIMLTLAKIFQKIPNRIVPISHTLVDAFIKPILSTTNNPQEFLKKAEFDIDLELWDNCIIALGNLVSLKCCKHNGSQISISNSVFNSLNFNNLDLICHSLSVLGMLFKNLDRDELEPLFDISLDSITNLIETKPVSASLKLQASIIYVYAEIFDKMGSDYLDFANNERHAVVLKRLNNVWKVDPNAFSFNEIINLFIYVVFAYRCLFEGFAGDLGFLKDVSNKIFTFLEGVNRMHLYNDELLQHIYILLRLIGETLGTMVNLKLNKKFVLHLVEEGEKSKNESLVAISKDLYKFIKNS